MRGPSILRLPLRRAPGPCLKTTLGPPRTCATPRGKPSRWPPEIGCGWPVEAADLGHGPLDTTTVQTGAPARLVLDHLADFTTVADWDPGVTEATLISGEPGRVGSRYRVTATFGPRRIPLEYALVERVNRSSPRS